MSTPESKTKACRDCRAELPLADYSKNHDKSDGLSIRCRRCTAERHRRWRDEHKAQWLANKREYRQAHPLTARMREAQLSLIDKPAEATPQEQSSTDSSQGLVHTSAPRVRASLKGPRK